MRSEYTALLEALANSNTLEEARSRAGDLEARAREMERALRGLRETRRVLKRGGKLLMIEHVLSERPWLRRAMHWLDPVTHRLWGAHIDRETVKTVNAAGFAITEVQDLSGDIVKRILANAP